MTDSMTVYIAELRFQEEPDVIQDRKVFATENEAEEQLRGWEYALDENMELRIYSAMATLHHTAH